LLLNAKHLDKVAINAAACIATWSRPFRQWFVDLITSDEVYNAPAYEILAKSGNELLSYSDSCIWIGTFSPAP